VIDNSFATFFAIPRATFPHFCPLFPSFFSFWRQLQYRVGSRKPLWDRIEQHCRSVVLLLFRLSFPPLSFLVGVMILRLLSLILTFFLVVLPVAADPVPLRDRAVLATPTPPPFPGPTLSKRQAPAPSATTSSLNIPQDAPAGGVSMIQPNPTSSAPLYKLLTASPITFQWTYTSLISTPGLLTMKAYCTDNAMTYDVSPPTGIPGTETSYGA
jgi:hypothetical protein